MQECDKIKKINNYCVYIEVNELAEKHKGRYKLLPLFCLSSWEVNEINVIH